MTERYNHQIDTDIRNLTINTLILTLAAIHKNVDASPQQNSMSSHLNHKGYGIN